MRFAFLTLAAAMLAGSAFAISVDVDPVSGTDNGSSPFLTLEAALTAVAGADAGADTINLLTNGIHQLSNTEVNITVAAADGNLTIQGSGGTATIVLGNTGGRHGQINVDGGQILLISNVNIIPSSAATGALGGDGFQIFNNTASGTATINMSDVTFAANNGLNQPVAVDVSKTAVPAASWVGDDWVDYFEDTAGTLTNVNISHAGDEGIIVRGGGTAGANVTITGNSVLSMNGGRAIQLPFGGSGTPDVPTFALQGSLAERVRVYGNSEDFSESAITCFNGNVTLNFADFVNNNYIGIRVDTDTCDSFTADHLRVAGNVNEGITFLFTTADLAAAAITNSTFHDQQPTGNNVEYVATATTPVTFTDCIFTGPSGGSAGEDGIDLQATPSAVDFVNCALVTDLPYGVTPVFIDQAANSETATVSSTPRYTSTLYDVTDAQNPEFLRVQYTPDDNTYTTASSTASELRGGNGLPLIEFIVTSVDAFELYR